jgi:hypothetical protein
MSTTTPVPEISRGARPSAASTERMKVEVSCSVWAVSGWEWIVRRQAIRSATRSSTAAETRAGRSF